MNTMTVPKEGLLAVLTRNRDAHRALFLTAQEVYRAEVIKQLDLMLEDARSGAEIRRHINLSPPEDHTGDYDRMIGLLTLSNAETVDLTLQDYDCYVQDNWSWSRATRSKHMAYASNNLSPMFVGENVSLGLSY